MSLSVSRATVEAFYAAYDSGDPQRIGAMADDSVEWDVFGPPGIMQICGQWRGRAAVIERFTHLVPQILRFKKFHRSHLLVDGDQSAACGQISSRHCDSGRTISHRVAHFVRYRDGKVLSFRAMIDTLDAAEQFMGRRIDLGSDAGADRDLISL